MRPDERLPAFPLDDDAGPATPLSAAASTRLIEGALDEALAAPPRRRRLAPWLAVAAAVLVGLPAGAAIWRAVRPAPAPAPRLEAPPTPKPAPEPRLEAPPTPKPAPEPEIPAPPLEPEPEVTPPAPKPEPRSPRGRRGRRSPPRPPTPAPPPAPAPTATELLDRASAQRGAREWAAAAKTYEALLRAHPGSGAAYVAAVARATIALEHLGRPADAARDFTAALRSKPRGPLDAEARWGLARARRALGDAGAERAALQRLLEDHPRSTYARLARARLEALE